MTNRVFTEGEKYRPVVRIDKINHNNLIPTVITVSGRRYVYDPGTVRKRRGRRRR